MTLVLDLNNVKLASINNKYISRQYILTKEYRNFKKLATKACAKLNMDPPYKITIMFKMYKDIDAPLKPVLDALETAGIITNDRYVTELHIHKETIKRGHPEAVKVWVEGV